MSKIIRSIWDWAIIAVVFSCFFGMICLSQGVSAWWGVAGAFALCAFWTLAQSLKERAKRNAAE
jgi:hypothetical protein